MAIPDFESIMLPLLECVKDGKEWSVSDAEILLIAKFKMTEEEANQLKPSSTTETVFQNRLRWARLYLKKANLLEDPRRGYTRITKDGLNVLARRLSKIDNNFLKEFPSFLEFYSKKKGEERESISIIKESQSPEDMIIEGINEIRRGLESEIIEKIINCPPDFFEKTVVQLLEKMGYGDGTPTGKSGDGGIDGMIKQDKLGLDEIYVQAKRWQNTVPGNEVRDFAGSLSGKKSKKGIFITTSNFSNAAIDFVKTVDSKIILIDGEKLAKLMFDYNIGFQQGDIYQLKKIDEDFFAE